MQGVCEMGVGITEIEGTITTKDGKTRKFSITSSSGFAEWLQWDANDSDLWNTTEALTAMCQALNNEDLMATDDDEEDED